MADQGVSNGHNLDGYRTYLMGLGIIIHQVLILGFGIDVPDDLWSGTIDAVFGIGALYFRWKAAVAHREVVANVQSRGQ